MKQSVKTLVINRILVTILVFLPALVFAQESAEKENPILEFTYLKRNDGSKLLTAKLTIFRNRITYPITGSNLAIFPGTEMDSVVVTTNPDGKAYLVLQPGLVLPVNKEGKTECIARFGGNDSLETAESSIAVQDAVLKMSLNLIDSVKTVTVWAFLPGNKQDSIPLAGEPVNIYVSRMFSLLKIGEGSFDDQGRFTADFPADLPGEADGNVQIIARIEDNEQYANIETAQSYPWGVPSMHGLYGSQRALWTEIAPVWMIITLTILLLGVWGHYMYVIIQLILIKRESKKLKP